MSEPVEIQPRLDEPAWVTSLATRRPDVIIMAPFLVYLLLLPLQDWVPKSYMPWAIAARGVVSMAVVWLFRHHFPPLGKPHWFIAITAGVLVAFGWWGGQHLFNDIHVGGKSLGGRLILFPGQPEITDPREGISAFSWWSQVVLRILVATTAVAVVEELFWRGFLLRALINWDRFDRVPLGTFTWLSFLGTSLISVLEHPDNWAVSILCWFVYNGLMYWTRSLLCLMLTHGITNLVLYVWVLYMRDWSMW